MDGDETGSKHTGAFVPYRCDGPGIDDNETQGGIEIKGCLGSWQRFPALLIRDIPNRPHNSPAHDDLFHPVIIGNLVQDCNMAGRDERGSEMGSEDAVDKGYVRRKSRPYITRGSDRDLSCHGTACTGT